MTDLVAGAIEYKDLHGKLVREHERLNKEPTSDNFMNFILTANHLYDWVVNDPSADPSLKSKIEADLKNSIIGSDLEFLQICRDIANASKHFRLTYPHQIIKRVNWPKQSWYGTLGLNSVEAYVELINDNGITLKKLVEQVFSYWNGTLGPSDRASRVA